MLSVLLEARRAPYKHELGRRMLDGLGMFEESGKQRNSVLAGGHFRKFVSLLQMQSP